MTAQHFSIFLMIVTIVAVIVFITLFFIPAPYGRHAKKGWGPLVPGRIGWILMEAPASLLFFFYFITGDRITEPIMIIFLIIWQSHYLHRAFLYPFSLKKAASMPFSIILFGIMFNVINTYIQGQWLFHFAPLENYQGAWFTDIRFIMGVLLFYCGYVINKHADYVLTNLRKPGETGYKIPRGGLYQFISCPNYFGEILTWTGWALATWSLAGAVFAIWTIANLAPRAISNHRWYRDQFPDYPQNRKALIPFIL